MHSYPKNFALLLLLACLPLLQSCKKEDLSPDDFGIFSSQDETTLIMNGVIDSNTPGHWENIIAVYPNVNTLLMKDCPGSDDDDANLKVSRKIRNQNVKIHLAADAVIASGAVDMFLAGTTRTREAGSQIGVHSWADGNGEEATDFPVGNSNHKPYIKYYEEMGFSETDASAFYYFTINAASANDIHWMTDEEIAQYKLLTQ